MGKEVQSSRVGLFGGFGIGNIGNEATLTVVLEGIRRVRPELEPLIICPQPERATQVHGVGAVDCFQPQALSSRRYRNRARRLMSPVYQVGRIARSASGLSALLFPGTGALDDYSAPEPWYAVAMLQWIVNTRVRGRSVQFIGVGAGPIQRRANRLLMSMCARLATHRSYRDEDSRNYLGTLGVNVSEDELVHDLVFAHDLSGIEPGWGEGQRKRLGVGVMGYRGWTGNGPNGERIYTAYLDKLATFVGGWLKEGNQVVLLPGKDTDGPAIQDLVRRLPADGTRERLSVCDCRDFRGLMNVVATTDLVISSRYHNLVAAFLMGRPAISLSYATKNDVLLDRGGLSGFHQPVESFDVPILRSQVQRVLESLDGYHRGVSEYAHRARVEATTALSHLAEGLPGSDSAPRHRA